MISHHFSSESHRTAGFYCHLISSCTQKIRIFSVLELDPPVRVFMIGVFVCIRKKAPFDLYFSLPIETEQYYKKKLPAISLV